jgi:hypothetical protein
MKKLLVILTATLVSVGAFAQGKINFNNDSLHLVYFTTDASGLAAGDAALAGRGPGGGRNPADGTLLADLYSGTSIGTMALVKSTTFTNSPAEGRWVSSAVTLPTSGGVTTFFQIQIHDSRETTAAGSQGAGHYFGSSPVFTAVPGSVTPVNLYAHSSPVNSTWPDGTFGMDQTAAGSKGAIELRVIPEPTTFALAGLGAAALMIFRRRK